MNTPSLFPTPPLPIRERLVVSFGGGVNSTAMLVGMWRRGIRPDAIVFSDTGGEKPGTYQHIGAIQCWLESIGWPAIVTVQYVPSKVPDRTLEEEVLRRNSLPALAYGWHTCSIKWKRTPFLKWLNANGMKPARIAYGIDAGETWRHGKKSDEPDTENWYPLVEWNWAREECVSAITDAGLDVPPKSSCFFCPAMRKNEVLELRDKHPDLLERALEIERRAIESGNAGTKTTKGLNRSWSWRGLLETDTKQTKLWPDADPLPCGCADGDGDAD